MYLGDLLNFIVPVLLMLYAGYCWIRQGVHVRGKGWQSRQEMPKTFWFTIILYVVISIGAVVGNLFWMSRLK
ncbi:MAG: hypothetical protein CMA65_03690 [Euryarchaeota archaeon]|nr:hypothetical protein [Euryarchaeota archaeon]